jgi:MoxR-like ATPase
MAESPWPIFRCDENGLPVGCHDDIDKLPDPPPWRLQNGYPPVTVPRSEPFDDEPPPHLFEHDEIELINAAMFLRRPLLITGPPGCGKSTIARSVAYQLKLGALLRWHINTRSTRREGLYHYDAVAQLQDRGAQGQDATADMALQMGKYLRLGPLGTALLPRPRPRVLLVDELDKSDIDLPNDLLDIFEEGGFEIPELARLADRQKTFQIHPSDRGDPWPIEEGRVQCKAFPIVIMTSNGERGFPAPFLRRCIRLDLKKPDAAKLDKIVERHLGRYSEDLRDEFLKRRDEGQGQMAIDQLLSAVHLLTGPFPVKSEPVRDALLRPLEQ